MNLFWGTLLITLISCLAMAIGLLLHGKPLVGGCGSKLPGSVRCATCPHRERAGDEEPSRGES